MTSDSGSTRKFGIRLKALLADMEGMNQTVLANELDTHPSKVNRWIRGTIMPPDDKTIESITKILVLRYEEIVDLLEAVEHDRRIIEEEKVKKTQLKPKQPITRLSGVHAPDVFITRQTLVDSLEERIGEERQRRFGITALLGMGGIGKSILSDLIIDKVKDTYPQGIVSVTMGKGYIDIQEKIRGVGVALGDKEHNYDGLMANKDRLQEFLKSKTVLIILDDVWQRSHAEAFKLEANNCHVLITTRIPDIAKAVNANLIEVEGFSEEQAVYFLKTVSQRNDDEYPQIARLVEYHPLALELTAKILRDKMSAGRWIELYRKNISGLKLNVKDSDDRYNNINSCITLSTNQLANNELSLYHSIGIFKEHKTIDQDLLIKYWVKKNSDYNDAQLELLVDTLTDLSLAKLNRDTGSIAIHDLLHDFNRNALVRARELANCHDNMLSLFNPDNKDWHQIVCDPNYFEQHPHLKTHSEYFFRSLIDHLQDADHQGKLWPLFCETSLWMDNNSSNPDPLRENLLLRIWHLWWKASSMEAKTFLTRKWLPKRIPKPRKQGYTVRTIAVRCANEVNFDRGIALALCHHDKRVRVAAQNCIYFLSHYDLKRVKTIIELASDRVVRRFWLPNPRVIQSTISTIFAVYDQFQLKKGKENEYNEILPLLKKIIHDITQKTVLRLLGPRPRILVTRVFYPVIRKRLVEAEAVSPNNFSALNAFFSQPVETQNFAIQSIKYFNVNYGSPEHLKDIIHKLLFRPDNTPPDRISGLIAEGILIAHGITDFLRVEGIIKEIAKKDKGNCTVLFLAAHVLYSIMAKKPETITDRALTILKGIINQWLQSSKSFGYGKAKDEYGCYQVYPLSYYTALWMIARPGIEIDLLDEYAKLAEELNDEKLRLHIAGMFGEFRCLFRNYPIALKTLKPYFENLKHNGQMWKTLVSSLGCVYSIHRSTVDELLEDTSAPFKLLEEIEAYSYQIPIIQSYMRIYQIYIDMLTSSNSHIIEILQQSLVARNLPTAIIQSANQTINILR